MAPPSADAGDIVVIGRLGAAHGRDGEVRFFPETDFPERMRAGRAVVLLPPSGGRFPTAVRAVRPGPRATLLLRLAGLPTPEAVSPYCNGHVAVHAADLPPLPEGRYYHHQLLGLTVLDSGGRPVGTLSRVEALPANDVYHVRRADGSTALVPAVHAAVERIDLTAGVVRLRDLPGLLDP